MKALSSSLIILAAAILITGGSHVEQRNTREDVQFLGYAVGVIGLAGWIFSMGNKHT